MRSVYAILLLLLPVLAAGSGCQAFLIGAGMAQSFEYQKRIEVLAEYEGLEHRTVAIVVDADLGILHQHPVLCDSVASGVGGLIAREVSGVRVLDPRYVREWQFTTPRWNAMPYDDMVKALNVDRIVFIDIHTFRLHPPGNRWIWEGNCTATVGIIERDGLNPDQFTDAYHVDANYPKLKELDRDSASTEIIQTGLLSEFIKHTAWIFYPHLEPKYPDMYKPELDAT
ncbi:MAG: hypothetical protein CMJ36_02720 [Phycisphaerae bacterium]|nr:hypothetical protein [Phycisphaerae bacterium]